MRTFASVWPHEAIALILELGKGFAFVGSQYHVQVGGQDYHLDLLFYHLRLRCFVVFDLKMQGFKPEDEFLPVRH